MKFTPTPLDGAMVIESEPAQDARGFFTRTFCRREFESHGLNPNLAQCSISYNLRRGTLRGMHYQTPPHQEAKLVRCTRGAIYDLIIDLRPDSISFKKWLGLELRAGGHQALYVPEGFAHGFQTLEDHSEVFYQTSEFYHPESARGVRWDDPCFGINWPLPNPIMNSRDRMLPDFTV